MSSQMTTSNTRQTSFSMVVLWLFLLSLYCLQLNTAIAQDIATNDETLVISTEKQKNADPLEKFNRKVYRFNNALDRKVLKPIAKRYVKYVPKKVRRGVRNFIANLREPTTIVNGILQGKPNQAAQDTLRFTINSTFGLLGIFDVAAHLKMPRNKEDFGQTLGKWGVPSGPYMVLPLFGPSNARDLTGLIPQYLYTDLNSSIDNGGLRFGVFAAGAVDTRANLLSLDDVLQSQLDPYVFIRESYTQRRIRDINDGKLEDDDDEFLNEILEQGD